MGLDTSRLEKVRRRGSNTIARCPACAEAGNDRKGEHLFINGKGQFGCVLYPGADGQEHRQRIFELAGIKDIPGTGFEVRKPQAGAAGVSVIQKDVLGHLGRFSQTHARKNFELHRDEVNSNVRVDINKPDPSVPKFEEEHVDDDPRPF
jgi:hypothetical protein